MILVICNLFYFIHTYLITDNFLQFGHFFICFAISVILMQVIFILVGLIVRLKLLNERLQEACAFSIRSDFKFRVKLVTSKDHKQEIVRNVFAAHGLVINAVEFLNSAYGNMVSKPKIIERNQFDGKIDFAAFRWIRRELGHVHFWMLLVLSQSGIKN